MTNTAYKWTQVKRAQRKRSRVVCLHNKGHSVCQLQKSQCFILLIILLKTLTFTYSGTGSTVGTPTADTHILLLLWRSRNISFRNEWELPDTPQFTDHSDSDHSVVLFINQFKLTWMQRLAFCAAKAKKKSLSQADLRVQWSLEYVKCNVAVYALANSIQFYL